MDFFHRFGVFKLQTLCLTLIIFFLNYSSKIFLFFSINLSISIYFPLMTNLTLFFFFFLFFFLSFYIFFTNPSNCSLFFTQQFWTLVYISFFPPLFSHFIIFFFPEQKIHLLLLYFLSTHGCDLRVLFGFSCLVWLLEMGHMDPTIFLYTNWKGNKNVIAKYFQYIYINTSKEVIETSLCIKQVND